ncbi:MAG TPA: Jag N-terminal domain-containing protein, partial [Acidimicrobiales bacterium]|nr:Jag N-terminal domain-containing protein [Acidimicrobiales bacterium]
MQWVVTTGRTVEEARERALDALGIDDADLEFEVLDEPRSSFFGLRRTDARIRARVRPTRPRPKIDRRNRRKAASSGGRRRRSKRGGAERTDDRDDDTSGAEPTPAAAAPEASGAGGGRSRRRRGRGPGGAGDLPDTQPDDAAAVEPAPRATEPPIAPPPKARPAVETTPASAPTETTPHPLPDSDDTPAGATGDSMTDISLDEQEPSAVGFVQGLVDAF